MKDYGKRINEWNDYANKLRGEINLKELADIKDSSKFLKTLNKQRNNYLNNKKYIKIPPRNTKYIDLNEYYECEKFYADLIYYVSNMADSITDNISNENYIEFKFIGSNKISRMSLIHYVFNMLMWYTLFVLEIDVTEDFLFMPKVFNNKEFRNYINDKVLIPHMHLVTMNQASELMARVHDIFILLCEKFGLFLGLSFSMYDILSAWDDKRIYDLNHTQIPDDMQIYDAEKLMDNNAKEYSKLIMSRADDNCLKPLIRSGQGANSKQLREYVISTGFKPTLSGTTINIKPTSNYITNGLRKTTDYIVDASGGRKANVLGTKIDTAGYIQRAFTKSSIGISLNPDPNYDCGTVNYYETTIKNDVDLERLHGRYYLTNKNTLRQLHKKDTDLIGETLKFRSPAFCAGGDNGICRYCYGHLYNQNVGIDIGINATLKLTEELYQRLMSAKHVLDTKTSMVKMCDKFDSYFKFDSYKINIKRDKQLKNFDLVIDTDSIMKNDDNTDGYKNEYIYNVHVLDKKTGDMYEIHDTKSSRLYISDYLIDIINNKMMTDDYADDSENIIKINMGELAKGDEELFFVNLENNELNKDLNSIKDFIENGYENKYVTDKSEFIDTLNKMIVGATINIDSVHVEVLCRRLIKNAKNIIEPLDFTKELKSDDILLTSIHNSILKSNSVINSLTFERIGIQFRDPATYKKSGTSPLDRMFV